MTKTPQLLPSRPSSHRPRSVLFVTLPGGEFLDIMGPMEAFYVANRVLLQRGKPAAYSLHVTTPDSQVETASGLKVCGTPFVRASPAHTLIIGGTLELLERPLSPRLLEPLRRLARGAQRLVSVCAGAFVLGQLGLLEGRRCTTHWLGLDALRSRFPTALVERDALYTHDGPIFTSAGVTTGIDLALYLIERDLGSSLALTVARLLVVFLHRPGGQSQFSASLHLRSGTNQRLRELIASIVERPRGEHQVEALARRVAMSPRHFARVFREETGETPAAFVERVRLDAARRELELTDHTVASIADSCGFGTDETMRRVFQRALGVSPADYRRRFHRQRDGLAAAAS